MDKDDRPRSRRYTSAPNAQPEAEAKNTLPGSARRVQGSSRVPRHQDTAGPTTGDNASRARPRARPRAWWLRAVADGHPSERTTVEPAARVEPAGQAAGQQYRQGQDGATRKSPRHAVRAATPPRTESYMYPDDGPSRRSGAAAEGIRTTAAAQIPGTDPLASDPNNTRPSTRPVLTAEARARERARQRQIRAVVAGILALILLAVVIFQLTHNPAAPTAATLPSPSPQPSPPATIGHRASAVVLGPPKATTAPHPTIAPHPTTGESSLAVLAVLGTGAGLSDPREAVALPNGLIAVADAGHRRLALLNGAGTLVRSVTTRGQLPLQGAQAVTAGDRYIYLLDAGRGAIERYTLGGDYVDEVRYQPNLIGLASDITIAPNTLYVASPRANGVALVSLHGNLKQQLSGPVGNGPTQFNRPSSIAVARHGRMYVVDSLNNRIKILARDGSLVRQLATVPSDAAHVAHVLPFPSGRLLVSDPTGALLIYPVNGGTPRRLQLRLGNTVLTGVHPGGLFALPGNRILVTDSAGNRLLIVQAP